MAIAQKPSMVGPDNGPKMLKHLAADDVESVKLKKSRVFREHKTQEPSAFEKDLTRLTQEIRDIDGSAEADQKWARPALKQMDSLQDSIDAEEAVVDGLSIVRLFGVTENGHSIMCNVTGFLHYFYVPAPVGFNNQHISNLQKCIEDLTPQSLHHIEIVQKESLWGFNGNVKSPFLKIVARDAKHINKLRGLFERGNVHFEDMFDGPVTSYDNVAYVLRAMIDCHIMGMSWITLPAKEYAFLKGSNICSTAQIQVSIQFDKLISHPSIGEWLKMAPIRVLSFDIECAGRKGIFPEANVDPVIQIANVVSRYGETIPFVRNVFTLDTCAQIVGTQIFEFTNERDLLIAWRNFVREVDPDVIIGYNIGNFDLPYLIDRAAALRVHEFPFFGRLSNIKQEVKDSTFSSKAYGTRESKVVNIDGRLQLDLLSYIQREYKLRSYTLNSVSSHFLGEQKEDVHHSIITELQNGTAESRRRLAVYCLKDAYLPIRLMDKLMCLVNYTEMARVTGVPFSYLLSRGQQIKVISQLYRKANEVGFVIPNMKQEGSTNEQYEGATVIEPAKGYYDVPIATLDFSSLYPSIMMAHNLCYTTLLDRQTISRLNLKDGVDYSVAPTGGMTISNHAKLTATNYRLFCQIGSKKGSTPHNSRRTSCSQKKGKS